MDQIVTMLSNSQVWTVILSGLAALCASLAPIVIARMQAAQAAKVAAAEVERAAHAASATLKATARKDAVAEWQALYGEREKQVAHLELQNADQQKQLDALKKQHDDCEQRHSILERKVESLTGTVTKIANGNH